MDLWLLRLPFSTVSLSLEGDPLLKPKNPILLRWDGCASFECYTLLDCCDSVICLWSEPLPSTLESLDPCAAFWTQLASGLAYNNDLALSFFTVLSSPFALNNIMSFTVTAKPETDYWRKPPHTNA